MGCNEAYLHIFENMVCLYVLACLSIVSSEKTQGRTERMKSDQRKKPKQETKERNINTNEKERTNGLRKNKG